MKPDLKKDLLCQIRSIFVIVEMGTEILIDAGIILLIKHLKREGEFDMICAVARRLI